MQLSRPRTGRVAGGVLLALCLVLTVVVAPAQAQQDLDAEQYFISLVNRDRQAAGLGTVAPTGDVRDVALAWSKRMASERRMSRNRRSASQYCCWRRAAENVGWTTIPNLDDPDKVTAAVERLTGPSWSPPGTAPTSCTPTTTTSAWPSRSEPTRARPRSACPTASG